MPACANVGVQQFGAADKLTEQDWEWLLNVNVKGTVRTVREFLPLLREGSGFRRIVFTGFVFGRDYRALQQNAYCYVHATEVGGTHPALLEAMGFGNCVLALAAPENIEALGEAGIAYLDERDFTEKLQRVLRDCSLVQAYRNRAQARVQDAYDWNYVVDQYEALFARMAGVTLPQRDAIPATASTSARETVARSSSS